MQQLDEEMHERVQKNTKENRDTERFVTWYRRGSAAGRPDRPDPLGLNNFLTDFHIYKSAVTLVER